MSELFDRVYRLEIGNAGETLTVDGFGPSGFMHEAQTMGGTATGPAQIRFRVGHNITGYMSIAEIVVYGLSKETRKRIQGRLDEDRIKAPYNRVRLVAGYRERHGQIFSGHIYNIGIGRDGPDSFVTLLCNAVDERDYDLTYVNHAFGPNTPVKELIKYAAQRMGLPVRFLGDFDGLRTMKDMPVSMTARAFLRDIGQRFRFSWLVENDELVVARDGGIRPDEHRYSASSGLIGTPQIHERGLDARVLLDATIKPRDQVIIENATGDLAFGSQMLTYQGTIGTGPYEAHGIVHSGDFYGGIWYSLIECFNPRLPAQYWPGG